MDGEHPAENSESLGIWEHDAGGVREKTALVFHQDRFSPKVDPLIARVLFKDEKAFRDDIDVPVIVRPACHAAFVIDDDVLACAGWQQTVRAWVCLGKSRPAVEERPDEQDGGARQIYGLRLFKDNERRTLFSHHPRVPLQIDLESSIELLSYSVVVIAHHGRFG
jgi:hypothetical protein